MEHLAAAEDAAARSAQILSEHEVRDPSHHLECKVNASLKDILAFIFGRRYGDRRLGVDGLFDRFKLSGDTWNRLWSKFRE